MFPNFFSSIEIFSSPKLEKVCTILVHRKIINCMKWHPHIDDTYGMTGVSSLFSILLCEMRLFSSPNCNRYPNHNYNPYHNANYVPTQTLTPTPFRTETFLNSHPTSSSNHNLNPNPNLKRVVTLSEPN